MQTIEIVKSFNNYLRIKEPDYAVMLTGSWGTGKTFFIKKYIAKLQSRIVRKKVLYLPLYGVKNESEIEKRIWRQMAQSFFPKINKKRLWIQIKQSFPYIIQNKRDDIIIFLLSALLLVEFLIAAKHPFDLAITIFSVLKIVATTSLFAWIGYKIYNSLKSFVFQKTLYNVGLIVFDDFERAEMSPVQILAYINHFVEHLNKHVIVVCNEEEITNDSFLTHQKVYKKNEDIPEINSTPFTKVKEKVIGQSLFFQQNNKDVLLSILKNSSNRKLTQIIKRNDIGYDWFIKASTPQDIPLNFRAWKHCCFYFESIFSNSLLEDSFVYDVDIIKPLIAQFFPLVYALQVHDFGNKCVFPKINIDSLFYCFSNKTSIDLGWFKSLFPLFKFSGALSNDIWDSIILYYYADPKMINDYWNIVFKDKNAFYNVLMNYKKRTDTDIYQAWCELRKQFKHRPITNLEIIVELFATLLEMVEEKCCPDKDISPQKILELAKIYCSHTKIDMKSRYDFDFPVFRYRYQDKLNANNMIILDNFLDFVKDIIRRYYQITRPAIMFEKLIKIIALNDNHSFAREWSFNNFDFENVFSNQDSNQLLQAILQIPIQFFRERLARIINNLIKSNFNSTEPYVSFKHLLLNDIEKLLLSNDVSPTLNRTQIQSFLKASERLTANLKEIENREKTTNN